MGWSVRTEEIVPQFSFPKGTVMQILAANVFNPRLS